MEAQPEAGEERGAASEGAEEKKAGLDPEHFTLVEAAQYGNLER